MRYPFENNWTQLNDGNIFGALNSTRNINFEKEGEAALSRKAAALLTGATANFGEPVAIVQWNDVYNVLTDEQMFYGDLNGTAWVASASSPTFTLGSDMMFFNGKLVASDDTQVHEWNGSAWTTDKITGLTASRPHPIALFESQASNQLAVGDDNTVEVYNTSYTASGSPLTLPSKYRVTCLAYRNGFLYVGTLDEIAEEARIFMWNGDGQAAQYSIPVGAGWIFSMIPYKSSVVCVTDEGELLEVVGTQVRRLAAFPVYYEHGSRWFQGTLGLDGKVFMNGMAAQGDTVYINISGAVDSMDMPDMKSGLWRYDPSVGLHHYAAATSDLVVKDTGITVATNEITTSANHNLITGDAVMFDNVSGLTGVSDELLYYAIVTGADTIKLGASRHQANEANEVTVSGTVTTDELFYVPNTDYGNSVNARSGPVIVTSFREDVYPLYPSDVIFGAQTQNLSGSNLETLCTLTPAFNHGNFVSQKIYTGSVAEVWKETHHFLTGILADNEAAVVKYQYEERLSMPTPHISVTWSDADTFTTTDERLTDNVKAGDEVVILEGQGQGRSCHVSSISVAAAGTTTVNVDESYGSAAATATVYCTTFKKAGSITNGRECNDLAGLSLNSVKSPWVRVKVELRGYEPRVAAIELSNEVDRRGV